MEIWATPTHPPLCTYTNSSLASCILVQLSDLCNLGFAVHVSPIHVEGMPVTGEVCRGASHLPNFLIYKKVPQIAVCEQSKSEKLGILCIFGQRNSLKFRKCQICTLWGKKKKNLQNFCKNAHIQKIRKRSTFEKFAPSPGGHLYFRLDIIRVKGLSKHTLNTYFSGMKIDPKYSFLHAFYLIWASCPFQNLSIWPKTYPFSNFARFYTTKRCMQIHCLVLKNNPNYVNFFTRMISSLKYKCPPLPSSDKNPWYGLGWSQSNA